MVGPWVMLSPVWVRYWGEKQVPPLRQAQGRNDRQKGKSESKSKSNGNSNGNYRGPSLRSRMTECMQLLEQQQLQGQEQLQGAFGALRMTSPKRVTSRVRFYGVPRAVSWRMRSTSCWR